MVTKFSQIELITDINRVRRADLQEGRGRSPQADQSLQGRRGWRLGTSEEERDKLGPVRERGEITASW